MFSMKPGNSSFLFIAAKAALSPPHFSLQNVHQFMVNQEQSCAPDFHGHRRCGTLVQDASAIRAGGTPMLPISCGSGGNSPPLLCIATSAVKRVIHLNSTIRAGKAAERKGQGLGHEKDDCLHLHPSLDLRHAHQHRICRLIAGRSAGPH
jgi:hypothetical protein